MQSQSKSQEVILWISKTDSKIYRKGKRPRITNTILKEKTQVRGLILLNFKTYYKATVIKAVWC